MRRLNSVKRCRPSLVDDDLAPLRVRQLAVSSRPVAGAIRIESGNSASVRDSSVVHIEQRPACLQRALLVRLQELLEFRLARELVTLLQSTRTEHEQRLHRRTDRDADRFVAAHEEMNLFRIAWEY